MSININGMSVSQKLDTFRFTEKDGDKACHIAQAADEARELEETIHSLQAEVDQLKAKAYRNDRRLVTLAAYEPLEDKTYKPSGMTATNHTG